MKLHMWKKRVQRKDQRRWRLPLITINHTKLWGKINRSLILDIECSVIHKGEGYSKTHWREDWEPRKFWFDANSKLDEHKHNFLQLYFVWHARSQDQTTWRYGQRGNPWFRKGEPRLEHVLQRSRYSKCTTACIERLKCRRKTFTKSLIFPTFLQTRKTFLWICSTFSIENKYSHPSAKTFHIRRIMNGNMCNSDV